MATRGRDGRGNTNRPSRLIINRVHEQFKPMSERRQENDYDTLLVYLPGFQKEYIKVTNVDMNVVRVRGERLVSENKWSRFQEDYQVPESCETRGIHARFNGGILTITMPRKTINAPLPPPTAATTTSRIAPKTEEQPRKPKDEPKEKKPDKHQVVDDALLPQPKPTSSSAQTKQPPSKVVPQAKEAMKLQNDVEKPSLGEKMNLPEGKGKEAMLEEETKRGLEGSKGKPNYSGVVSGGLRGIVVRRGMMNADKKLLVNVGVGVLMILALGVHVSYTIGLIGKGK